MTTAASLAVPTTGHAGAPGGASSHEPPRVLALDGVRGTAILLVLAFHFAAFLPREGAWGYVQLLLGMLWVGVDLFFVLSGFLISGILLDTRERPGYYRTFYMRRALRIFPLYYASILLFLAARAIWPDVGALLGRESLLPAATYVQNVTMSLPGGLEAVPMATYHFWSLAIEEQFYLLWPYFVLRLERGRLAAACVVIMVGCVVVRGVLWGEGVDSRALYFLTLTRMDAFAAGAFVSVAMRTPALAGMVARAAPAVTIAGAVATWLLFRAVGYNQMDTEGASFWFVTAGFSLLAVTFGGLVAWCARPGPMARVASLRPLRFFGQYSYALYVFHPVIGVWLWEHARAYMARTGASPALVGLATVAAAFVLSVVVARLSWTVLESPFLRLKSRFPSGGHQGPANARMVPTTTTGSAADSRRQALDAGRDTH